MQLQTTSPESKFPNEYSDVIFIQIGQHLKKLLQKYKGSRYYESQCIYTKIHTFYIYNAGWEFVSNSKEMQSEC